MKSQRRHPASSDSDRDTLAGELKVPMCQCSRCRMLVLCLTSLQQAVAKYEALRAQQVSDRGSFVRPRDAANRATYFPSSRRKRRR